MRGHITVVLLCLYIRMLCLCLFLFLFLRLQATKAKAEKLAAAVEADQKKRKAAAQETATKKVCRFFMFVLTRRNCTVFESIDWRFRRSQKKRKKKGTFSFMNALT